MESPLKEAAGKGMSCRASDDVIVKSLRVISGPVHRGDVIAELSSININRFRARLGSVKEIVAIHERQFTGGRIDKLLQILEAERKAAAAAFDSAQKLYSDAKYKNEAGVINSTELLKALAELEASRTKLAVMETLVLQEPKRVQDAKDTIAIAKKQIAEEESFLGTLESKLIVISPVDGNFVAAVGVGWFLKKRTAIGNRFLSVDECQTIRQAGCSLIATATNRSKSKMDPGSKHWVRLEAYLESP